jgi:hypothetical protein
MIGLLEQDVPTTRRIRARFPGCIAALDQLANRCREARERFELCREDDPEIEFFCNEFEKEFVAITEKIYPVSSEQPTISTPEESSSLPVFSLLSCTGDDFHTLIEEALLKEIFVGRFTIKATGFHFAEDFLDAVRSQGCDLAGITLSDTRFREGDYDLDERIRKTLELVTTAKAAGARFVFAITGIPIEWSPELPERVKNAGGDFFLRAPFDMEDFKRELERCMAAGEHVG